MKRRNLLSGLGAALLAAAGGAAWRFHLFWHHYPPTPYDDLLGQIADREPARAFGQAALKAMPATTAASLALQLRRDRLGLNARAALDPQTGELAEVQGWLVPKSVALYAALAASV